MSDRFAGHAGITSCRKAALALAGTTLLIGADAHAAEAAAGTATGAEGAAEATADSGQPPREGERAPDDIVITGERYRINTLNSRLPDLRDAPQSISVIPREVMEQQSAATLRDVLRNVSGISMAAGEGGGGPAGQSDAARIRRPQRHLRRRHPRLRKLHARHV